MLSSLTPESATPKSSSPGDSDITSVRAALRSPRRLRTEVLAGLVSDSPRSRRRSASRSSPGSTPRVGLFASFTRAVSISFLGGRPAMISAATGAVAHVIAPVMRNHGFDYFVATVILAALLQVILGVLGVAKLMGPLHLRPRSRAPRPRRQGLPRHRRTLLCL
ncbi:hypothetical protein [Kribbella qitaiheensis]|uniref:hypothetical protein n=1 Tax=Kribbella qitaiheensis TaxID=1544730 RepID=UPI001CA48B88|nr:hypothetical protein [Kribbella qitaiheensis]